MAMSIGGGRAVRANINVTPMIDVLLVLLIIFMAIAPVAPKGLDALAPQQAPDSDAIVETVIVIGIDKGGTWRLNSEEIAEDRVEARLLEIFKSRAERVVFVKGDRGLEYQTVARAVDYAHAANIDRVGLLTAKAEDAR